MISRRSLGAVLPALLARPAFAADAGGFAGFLAGVRAEARAQGVPVALAAGHGSFAAFLDGVRAQARRAGIAPAILSAALTGLQPNQGVLARERHQPEFTMTWAQYRALLVTPARIRAGRAAYAGQRAVFAAVARRFGVGPGVILGIWGIESNFGTETGGFNVIDALATLAWASGRPAFFRAELLAALRILGRGDIGVAQMTGSYAGAMGQPQFMPSSFLRYAVAFRPGGRRNIWTDVPDVLASIANYLAHNGWRAGPGWGLEVAVPAAEATLLGGPARPLASWRRLGLRPEGPHRPLAPETPLALLRPDGPAGPAYLVSDDFAAIRRYNPSDFYALAVGLLGDRILGSSGV